MDELVDAIALVGLDHFLRETGQNDALDLAFQQVAGLFGDFGIFVVRRAEHHDVGLLLEGGLDAFLGRGKTVIVNDFVAGHAKEVGGEARTGAAHSQIAVGEQEHFGAAARLLGGEAQMLEGFGSAVGFEDLHLVALLAMAAAARFLLDFGVHRLGQVGILVGAEDGGFAGGDVHIALLGGLGDFVLHITFADGFGKAAFLLDGEELLPSVLSDRIGQIFNIIAAGCGVDDFVQVGLFLEQQLLVAGDAVAEVVGLFESDVERRGRNRVGAGDGGTHRLGGGAQHIDVGVEDRLVPRRRGRVDVGLQGAVARRFVLLGNLAPQHTCGADFGNFHKVVAADGEVENQVLGHQRGVASAFGQFGHQLVGNGKAEAQLLHDVRAGVVEQRSADGQHAEFGQVLLGIVDELDSLVEVAVLAAPELAVLEGVAIDVEIHRAAYLLGIEAVLAGHGDEEAQGVDELGVAAIEVDCHRRQVDVLQQGGHLLLGLDGLGAESDGCGAALHGVEGVGVSLGGVFLLDILTDVPHVVVAVLATRIGELVGVRVQIFNVFQVFSSVVGLYLETFDGFPNQFFLVVSTFEVLVDDFFPFFGRNGRKFGEQFIVFHYLMYVLFIRSENTKILIFLIRA